MQPTMPLRDKQRAKQAVTEMQSKPAKETRMGDNGFPLTEEQDHGVDLSLIGGDLKIEAFAGAGKTSTLSAIAKAKTGQRGLYIAFNKAIAEEAKSRFPGSVDCRTAHSLAFGAVGVKYKNRFARLNGSLLAKYLNVKTGFTEQLTPTSSCMLVQDTITKFTQSADPEVTKRHLPWSILFQEQDEIRRDYMADRIVNLANKTWQMMIDLNHDIPVTHDVYLKLWVMSNPVLRKDFILFDEAQDANQLMLSLVQNQDAQTIYVGDRYQQIYSWRGAVNAMDEIKTRHSCQITQSFRFGQGIADVANKILNNHLGADVNIRGFDPIKSTVSANDNPNAILFRTNGALLGQALERMNDQKVAITGGVAQLKSLIMGARDLMDGKPTIQRELMLFSNWDEVVEYAESETGRDLKLLVKTMENNNPDKIINSLTEIDNNNEKDADVILSTGHKSKGREWDNVKLADDFKKPPEADDEDAKAFYNEEESNLLYVAATRAVKNLDISECDAALHALNPDNFKPHEYFESEQDLEAVAGPR